MPSKKILVAGGAGFVGSNLCAFLVKKGYTVFCLDNLSSGRISNILPFLKSQNFKFIKGDVTKPLKLKVNEIYHLASLASPPVYQKHPIATWQANTLGTLNLLNLAKSNQAKFLFASTSEVYGDPKIHPQKEIYWGNVNPVGIRSCYDESKRAGESLAMDFYRQFKTQIKIVRIFNTYGPNMSEKDGRVVSNFIVQSLQNKPITVYGSGRQTRSFQYVDDLIFGLVKMMQSKNFTGPVNLGNPKEFTISDLAKKIIGISGSKSKIVFKPLPEDDPKQRRPDISLALKKLSWEPKVNLDMGLKSTIQYFKKSKI